MRFLILVLLLTLPTTEEIPTIIPPSDVLKMVEPILDLCGKRVAFPNEHQNDYDWQTEKLLGELLSSKHSDEALVVLMNFYIGESTGADLHHQITVRGKRMLPLLTKYRNAKISFPDRNYPSSISLASDVRNEDFDEVIKYVRAGKILGED